MDDLAWSLTIVGDWGHQALPDLPQTEVRCRLLGAVPHPEIPGVMRAADAIVIPSRYENFCNVALEAMAAGRAVLGSRCGGIPDLVEEGVTGLLFEPGAVRDLEARLRHAIGHPEVLSRMGREGWDRARAYSWQRVARETDSLLRWLNRSATPGVGREEPVEDGR